MSLLTVLVLAVLSAVVGGSPSPAAAVEDKVIVSFGFDDARSSQYSALSVFGKYGMPATLYVNTGTVGKSGFMSWQQLHQFADAGHEIGGHTVNHAPLTDVDEATARAEIQGDITTLLAQGFPRPVSFAYPYGYYGPDVERYVAEAGYANARTTDIARETSPPADPYALRIVRGSVDGSEGLDALKADVTAAEGASGKTHLVYLMHDFYSPIDDTVDEFLAWLKPRAANGTVVKTVGEVLPGSTGGANQAPVASAGPAQTVSAGANVQLDGSGSSDPNGDPLTYQWSQTGGTPVTLSSSTAVKPTFTAPASASTLTFELVVNDGQVNSSPSTVTVTVTGGAANQPPVASAGPAQTVSAGSNVQLDGSGSSDPDGDPLTYQWSQTGGTPVTLSSSTAVKPTFTAPDSASTLTFELVANDGQVNSSPSTVTITVQAAEGPRYRSSSSTGNDAWGASVRVPVPTGAAAGDVVLVAVSTWGSTAPSVTPPSGFTLKATYTGTSANGGADTTKVYWKRLTAADSGTYRFAFGRSAWASGHALAVSGAAASGDPIEAIDRAGSASATTFPSTSVTTSTVPFLAWFGRNDQPAQGAHTPPTGFTEVQDRDCTAVAYRRPGAAGTYSAAGASYSGSANPVQAILVAVRP